MFLEKQHIVVNDYRKISFSIALSDSCRKISAAFFHGAWAESGRMSYHRNRNWAMKPPDNPRLSPPSESIP